MEHDVALITGTSGTGKTTVLRELSARGYETIGIDEEPHLAYWIDKDTGEPIEGDVVFDDTFLANHEWECDIALLKQLIAQKEKPVVICGSCDNIRECIALAEVTLLLHCPPAVFLQRIAERTDNDFGKTEAAKQALLGYYEEYYRDCQAVGGILIDSGRPLDEVMTEVTKYIS